MQKIMLFVFSALVFFSMPLHAAVTPGPQSADNTEEQALKAATILTSLLDLKQNIKEQIHLSQKKLKKSTSEEEQKTLKEEIAELDKQLAESTNDFERVATGVEAALFAEKQPETFSWQDELTSLVEPAIKELKRFTIRARQKTNLKDKIIELQLRETAVTKALSHLQMVLDKTAGTQVHKEAKTLQPEWLNINKRLKNKLELSQRELSQLEEQHVSLVESSSRSIQTFFKNRGLYLVIAILVFIAILLACRLMHRITIKLFLMVSRKQEQRSVKIRLLYIIFQVLSIVLAVIGFFFVLYLAEDWFLLSMAIIFFFGLSWTIRQGVPKLWQQGRLMLNIGAVREDERLVLHGVPWRVASINVFCKLVNPSLGVELRLPIEEMTGLISRPYDKAEPWFPCQKGDWLIIGETTRMKVVSLSHEQVELVERGGRRVVYPTEAFLQSCPVNISRNFSIRVPFGLSYNLQKEATTTIPAILKEYIKVGMEEKGYSSYCLNLDVEFSLANSSSLDLIVLGDFEGEVAANFKGIERTIQKLCVDCCTENSWEIPFPQLSVHKVHTETS